MYVYSLTHRQKRYKNILVCNFGYIDSLPICNQDYEGNETLGVLTIHKTMYISVKVHHKVNYIIS